MSTISIVFDQPVIGFDLADLSLTPNGGANLLVGGVQTLSTNDNITWTLGNLAGITDPVGTYLLTVTAAGSGITGSASGLPITAGATDSFTVLNASVSGRRIFYNESAFDGNNLAATAQDDGTIAPDKVALLPGGTATFVNYTSYSKGINGVMVDIAGLAGTPTAGDFTFRTGNDNTPSGWALLATSPSISVRPGAGVGGSDRVTLIWPNFAVMKQWLQITVNPSTNTGVRTPDVFYFGNAVGESGNSTIDAARYHERRAVRENNPHSIANPTDILDRYDYNRDTPRQHHRSTDRSQQPHYLCRRIELDPSSRRAAGRRAAKQRVIC